MFAWLCVGGIAATARVLLSRADACAKIGIARGLQFARRPSPAFSQKYHLALSILFRDYPSTTPALVHGCPSPIHSRVASKNVRLITPSTVSSFFSFSHAPSRYADRAFFKLCAFYDAIRDHDGVNRTTGSRFERYRSKVFGKVIFNKILRIFFLNNGTGDLSLAFGIKIDFS